MDLLEQLSDGVLQLGEGCAGLTVLAAELQREAGGLVSRKAGFHPHPDPELVLLQEPAVEMLGLRDLSLAALLVDLEDEISTKHRLFDA